MNPTFSSYCGLAILHSLMYKKVADAQYRSKLSNELMMYHMKVGPSDNSVYNNNGINIYKQHPDLACTEVTRCCPQSSFSNERMFDVVI